MHSLQKNPQRQESKLPNDDFKDNQITIIGVQETHFKKEDADEWMNEWMNEWKVIM